MPTQVVRMSDNTSSNRKYRGCGAYDKLKVSVKGLQKCKLVMFKTRGPVQEFVHRWGPHPAPKWGGEGCWGSVVWRRSHGWLAGQLCP